MQKDFYKKFVQPTLDKNGKIYVIISDALRYEIAHEFVGMMRQEDMFEAKISPIVLCSQVILSLVWLRFCQIKI